MNIPKVLTIINFFLFIYIPHILFWFFSIEYHVSCHFGSIFPAILDKIFRDNELWKERTNHLVGKHIKRLRKKLKNKKIVTQFRLRDIEISTGTYSKIEMGLNNLSVYLLIALTHILSCDYNAFFEYR